MRYARSSFAPAGFGHTLPSPTLEFFGRVSSTICYSRSGSFFVMPGLVPGIHVFLAARCEDVDGGDKPGHDARLVNARLRLDVGDLVGQRVGVHRAVVDRDLA